MRTMLDTSLTASTSAARHSFAMAPEVAAAAVQRSPWHSPIPYLFGGLAAMLGLIAFALLILACSYWRLSRDQGNQQQSNEDGDLEKGDGLSKMKGPPVYEEKIVVIMAGNDKPTFLATPALMFAKPVINSNDDVKPDDQSATKDGAKESTSSSVEDDKSKDDETQHQH